PDRRPHGRGERRAPAHLPRPADRRAQEARGRRPRRRPHGAPRPPPAGPALGRPAAARRRRARDRGRPAHPARRRADRQPRLQERRRRDGAPRAAPRQGRHDLHGHPQPRLRAQGDPRRPLVRRQGGRRPPRPVGYGVTPAPRLLVADDQPDVLEAVRMLARSNGFDVRTATSPAAVLALCEAEDFDVCLLDLNYARDTTSGREGMDLLTRLREIDPALPVVVMTAWGSIEGAVEAIRRGARDYLQKPWDNTRLVATLTAQLELRRALRTVNRLDAEAARARQAELPAIVARSRAMQQVMALVERVAPSSASVLITGEHGTGKEVLARVLHASSARRDKAFVAVNAGGISDGVLESELFGHVKGAFTDARSDRTGCCGLADGGTLFLDEIANMPHGQQARLLRVLQTGEFHPVGSSRARRVDVRVLAATNADVAKEAAEGRFREDLLYRLNTVEIQLPPLRDRREDIPELVAAFLARSGKRLSP